MLQRKEQTMKRLEGILWCKKYRKEIVGISLILYTGFSNHINIQVQLTVF